MIAAVLLAILGTLLVHSVAAAGVSGDPPRAAGLARLQFREHLGLAQELRLTGTTDGRSASFTLPTRWKVLPGSALHLFVAHSRELDGSRSFLSVTLNYGILRSLRLDPQNATVTEVIVPIPPPTIRQRNELVFSVEQFAEPGTRSGETWTTISSRSFLEVRYEEAPPDLNVGRLPASLLEPHPLGTSRLAVLLPRRADPATLEATALLVANFSRRLSPDRVHVVRSLHATRDPLLVVGTPADHPELVALRARFPLEFASGRGRTVVRPKNGSALADNEGLVVLATRAPADPNAILLVTANSGSGVLRAARNVISPTWSGSGTLARVSTEARPATSRAREWQGFIPPRSFFTLADLGLEDLKITPERDSSLEVPLNAPPDARFFDYGTRLALKFKLNPDLYVGDASLLVQMNDVTVAEYVVKEEFRRTVGSVSVVIPSNVLKPRNVLRIKWKGPSRGATQGVIAWLLSTSELYLPRYYERELPDLGALRFALYPFSLKGDLADVVVVLPSEVNEEIFSALVTLSACFARLAPAQSLAFRVRQLGELNRADLAQSHVVFLNLEDRRDSLAALLPNWRPRAARGHPTVRELISPWNRQRYVLVVSAPSGRQLHQAVADVFSEATLNGLRGDAASLATAGHPESFVVGPRHKVVEYSYQAFVEAWLRTHWLALPIILITTSALLFVGVRLALRHYRADRERAPSTTA